MADGYQRPLPALTADNRHFWTGGEAGELRVLRCRTCGFWLHPPEPRCPRCLSEALAPEAVSGRGEVETFTLNMKAWGRDMVVPYVVAIVALPEQMGLRVTTNIVGCAPESVRIGMRVRVVFEQDEDVWLPMFTPA